MAFMRSEPPWLNTREQHLWRAWTQLNAELSATLQREMQKDAKLSMSDYGVLVHLTDSPEGRVRVSDLARVLQWEISRVSHQVTRMERRGLVQRSECVEDGRGAFVVVTARGRAAIEQAAPGHVTAVRRLVFDVLDDNDVATLSVAIDKMLAALHEMDRATS
jgi:DNA-binding MarR family transcriptional regulator